MTRETSKMEKYYIAVDGTTARRVETVGEETVSAPKGRDRFEEERRLDDARRSMNRTLRNQERALSFNRAYVAFLSITLLIMLAFCGGYVYLQTSVTNHLKTISTMESHVIDLRAENDETLMRIESAIDFEEVKTVAMEEYGMDYPTADQIVYYTVDESDTMTQYAKAP